MFELLRAMSTRPEPFSAYTAADLWTRPHIAKQMLGFHLDTSSDLASRRAASIEGITEWLDRRFDLVGKRVCDLGCGPGLYSSRLAMLGAVVTGVDFSANSIAYAREHFAADAASLRFEVADYLIDPLPQNQDLILLIYADFCALSPNQRHRLLMRMAEQLKPGGHIVFDVFTDRLFATRSEALVLEENLMDGFWAPAPYVGLQRNWCYEDQRITLDHYLIAESAGSFAIYNWMQYYSPSSLSEELAANGFEDPVFVDMLTGNALGEDYGNEFGVILHA